MVSLSEMHETYSAAYKTNQVKHQKLSYKAMYVILSSRGAVSVPIKGSRWMSNELHRFFHLSVHPSPQLFAFCFPCVRVGSEDLRIHLQFCAQSQPAIYFQILEGESVTVCWCALRLSLPRTEWQLEKFNRKIKLCRFVCCCSCWIQPCTWNCALWWHIPFCLFFHKRKSSAQGFVWALSYVIPVLFAWILSDEAVRAGTLWINCVIGVDRVQDFGALSIKTFNSPLCKYSLLLIRAGRPAHPPLKAPLKYLKDKRVPHIHSIFYSAAIHSALPVKIIILHTLPFTTNRESEYIRTSLFTICPD